MREAFLAWPACARDSARLGVDGRAPQAWEGLFLGAIRFPVLFWMHPSCGVLVGAVLLVRFWERGRAALWGAASLLLGGMLGAVGIWQDLCAGATEIMASNAIQQFVQTQGLTWHALAIE